MVIWKGFQFRIYPTEEQQEALATQFGHARFVYNFYLELRSRIYAQTGRGLNYNATADHLAELKAEADYVWLKEADAQVLQQKLMDLQKAFKKYFRMCKTGTLPSGKGKKPRKDGKRRGYPRYKSRRGRQSIRYPQRFKVGEGEIYLPKVGWVPMVKHRPMEGEMKNCTVSTLAPHACAGGTKSGKYFVSINCEVEVSDPEPRTGEPAIGLDMGLMDFITTSEGWKVPVPQYLRKSERRLKIRQRSLSRKTKGSQNDEEVRRKLARQHEKVANQRRDFHQQLSAELAKRYGQISFEDLNIQGMLGNHRLAKSIQDAGWAQFIRFCEYKQAWSGGTTRKADRWFPSSKACSACGSLNHNLKLSEREWICLHFGSWHDRDENAAKNVLNQTTVRDDGKARLSDISHHAEGRKPSSFSAG